MSATSRLQGEPGTLRLTTRRLLFVDSRVQVHDLALGAVHRFATFEDEPGFEVQFRRGSLTFMDVNPPIEKELCATLLPESVDDFFRGNQRIRQQILARHRKIAAALQDSRQHPPVSAPG